MPRLSPLALSSRQATLLIALGAPLLFLHCIDYVVETTPASLSHRDLINADLFSGEAAINRAFGEANLKSGGFLRSIQLLLRLERGGLATAGPPCGSFIFLNMGTSGRSKARPLGGKYQYVKRANTIVCRLVLLLLLGFVRCTISLVEQPSSTLMLCFPYIRWFAKLVALFYNWIEARFPMAVYGHSNAKPTVTFGTAPWGYRLQKKMSKSVKKRIRKAKPMVRHYVDSQGKKRVCGQPKVLRKSQVYPLGYGRAVRKHHMIWMERADNIKVLQDALYPPQGDSNAKVMAKVPQAPYRWRHACLSQLQAFLRQERDAGRYHPLITEGLN